MQVQSVREDRAVRGCSTFHQVSGKYQHVDHRNSCRGIKKASNSPHLLPLRNIVWKGFHGLFPVDSAACCSLWFWDWLLCFFPLRRLAEMENRNGSYLNDSISPNESMWEPLFCFSLLPSLLPFLPPIDPLAVVNLLCHLCSHWLVVTVAIDMRCVVSDCFIFHKNLTQLCLMLIPLWECDVLEL